MGKGAGESIDASLPFLDIGARERGCRGGAVQFLGVSACRRVHMSSAMASSTWIPSLAKR